MTPMTPIDPQQQSARRHVRRLRSLYRNFGMYVVIVAGLGLINGLASPGYWWVKWPALGLALAASFQAFFLLGFRGWLGPEWQERKVQQVLARGRKG
jgi:hypothetical protein